MSYDVIFDKLSIQLSDDEFMTMVLSGCNNLVDENHRIVRSWCALWPHTGPVEREVGDNFPWGSLDELSKRCDDYEAATKKQVIGWGETYDPKSWWWYKALRLSNGKMSFGQYKGLFVNAAKKSITIERLLVEFHAHLKLSVRDWSGENKFEARTLYPQTGSDFKSMFQELCDYVGPTDPVFIEMSGCDSEFIAKKVRDACYPVEHHQERIEVDRYWTIKAMDGYLRRLTKNGSYQISYGFPVLKYASEEEAKKKLKYYHSKRPWAGFEVEPVNRPTIIKKVVKKAA